MIVSQAMEQINNAYRGADDDVPTAGSPDYSLWLNTMNAKVSEFATDSKNTWSSLFSPVAPTEVGTGATTGMTTLTGTSTFFTDYRVGDKITVQGETERTIDVITSDTVLTVTVAFANTASAKTFTHKSIIATGVQSYNLNRRFSNPSDKIKVNNTNDTEFVIVKAKERDDQEVYIYGMNPQVLVFVNDVTDTMIGGELEVPGYYMPNDLVDDNSVIPVDDPFWLVYETASELSFNDLTYESKYPDLNGKANNRYSMMVRKNRRGTYGNPGIVPTVVNRILSPSGEGN